MRNLKTIEKKVRAILEKNEDARNDDMVLYLALCNVCLKDAGAMPLAEIMTQHKYLGLPNFESVSRTRRKLHCPCILQTGITKCKIQHHIVISGIFILFQNSPDFLFNGF